MELNCLKQYTTANRKINNTFQEQTSLLYTFDTSRAQIPDRE